MKKILCFAFTALIGLFGFAQIQTPAPSPFQKIEQKVGLTDVVLEYSRPSLKGREAFGNLVPYGKMWRAGANKNTTISFSDAVIVDGSKIDAGSYAIFITPYDDKWDIYFYTDTNNWGVPRQWDEDKVAAKVTAETMEMPMTVETYTITFDNLVNDSAELSFIWENTMVNVPFEVPTEDKVEASIEQTMSGPGAGDYFNAAVYYMEEDKDLEQAKTWMNKAMEMTPEPAFWQLRQQSLLYAKMGNRDKAIEIAKKSLEGAKAAGNEDYIKMNKASLKEWGAM